MSSQEFVYSKFCEYYRDPLTKIPSPVSLEQREFAYLLFKERFMIRHKRFSGIKGFQTILSQFAPSDVYHSCAYYENPDFEMEKKGWIGSDLVFDIDADHIPSSCDKIHDEFKCVKCGFSGKGITPEVCPACEGQKFETKTWPCDLCLQSAREETAKLIDMLEKDFGFSNSEIRVFFSGHRGFHVHIENESIRTLDAMARKEVVDYITGTGLSVLESSSKEKRKKKNSEKFMLLDSGWDRRLKLGIQDFILNADRVDLKNIGLKNYSILDHKKTILDRCINEGRWESVPGVSSATWKRIAFNVRDVQSSKIDTVVTTDIHRLIRMNGTLHGKTGLKKVEFPVNNLDDFDPFVEAVAFKKGTAEVLVSNAPEFRMSGETLGPYKNKKVDLPVAAAVMLICKGRAEVTA